MSDDREELKTFLDSVLQPQNSTDESWRNMGRSYGLYFLGVLGAGVEAPHALDLTKAFIAAMVHEYKPQP